MHKKEIISTLAALVAFVFVISPNVFAQNKNKTSKPEKLNVRELKKRYWSEKENYDVVQNRAYSKKGKAEINIFGGWLLSDPFLQVYNLGGSITYHFTEYFGFSAMYWKYLTSDSAAGAAFKINPGVAATVNPEKAFYGGEFNWNLIYGKRNLLGSDILYYDMHLLFGFGMTSAQDGNYATPLIGIGQQTYLTSWLALRTDWRLLYYKDQIAGASRNNFSHSITLGVSFFLF